MSDATMKVARVVDHFCAILHSCPALDGGDV